MPRAIWSGTISFGLLNVPVKLYSAVSKKTIRFKELREDDNARVRHKRVAEGTDEEVPYEKIVKGYELSADRFVVLTPEELSELAPRKTRAIEIQDFVDLDDIDPIYFEQPYYLAPAEGAEKAYSLLAKAMEEERKVAIARFVLRNKEHLAAIRATGGVVTLATMRFADEVLSPNEMDDVLPDEEPKVQKREVDMARQLIGSLTSEFDPAKYRDEYREELLDLIEKKADGKVVAAPEAEEPEPTKAPDLMAALEESLAAVKGEELGGDGDAKRKASAKRSKSSRQKASSDGRKSSASKRRSSSKSRSKARS